MDRRPRARTAPRPVGGAGSRSRGPSSSRTARWRPRCPPTLAPNSDDRGRPRDASRSRARPTPIRASWPTSQVDSSRRTRGRASLEALWTAGYDPIRSCARRSPRRSPTKPSPPSVRSPRTCSRTRRTARVRIGFAVAVAANGNLGDARRALDAARAAGRRSGLVDVALVSCLADAEGRRRGACGVPRVREGREPSDPRAGGRARRRRRLPRAREAAAFGIDHADDPDPVVRSTAASLVGDHGSAGRREAPRRPVRPRERTRGSGLPRRRSSRRSASSPAAKDGTGRGSGRRGAPRAGARRSGADGAPRGPRGRAVDEALKAIATLKRVPRPRTRTRTSGAASPARRVRSPGSISPRARGRSPSSRSCDSPTRSASARRGCDSRPTSGPIVFAVDPIWTPGPRGEPRPRGGGRRLRRHAPGIGSSRRS